MEKEKKERQETLTPLQKKGFAFVYEMQRQNEELAAQVADLQRQVSALSKFAKGRGRVGRPGGVWRGEPQRREAMAALVKQTDDLNRQNDDFFDDEAWNQLKEWVNRYYSDADG